MRYPSSSSSSEAGHSTTEQQKRSSHTTTTTHPPTTTLDLMVLLKNKTNHMHRHRRRRRTIAAGTSDEEYDDDCASYNNNNNNTSVEEDQDSDPVVIAEDSMMLVSTSDCSSLSSGCSSSVASLRDEEEAEQHRIDSRRSQYSSARGGSSALRLYADDADTAPSSKQGLPLPHAPSLLKQRRRHRRLPRPPPPLNVEDYMTKREMTRTQERWNALTMIPTTLYCLYFLLTAQWLDNSSSSSNTAMDSATASPQENQPVLEWGAQNHAENWMETIRRALYHSWFAHSATDTIFPSIETENASPCWESNDHSWWHWLPPLPILAVAIGICLHAPFSFLYHWRFAHRLPATARSQHWSRRMDQSMIHVCSTCLSYAVSGSWIYLLLNTVYNADCCRRQFRPVVRPKWNQVRIFISILGYTAPLAVRGEWQVFAELWAVLFAGGYFFVTYPVGGWSHAVFHLILVAVPPLLFQTAVTIVAQSPSQYYSSSHAAVACATAVGLS